MAVHTGEAHERDGDYFGPTVNRAARLRSLAQGDQLLLSEAVATLVRDDLPEGWDLVELGEQALRGQTRPERVFTLIESGAIVDHRATVVARSCPYMGLLPFQPEDDRVFFGRTALLDTLLGRLRGQSIRRGRGCIRQRQVVVAPRWAGRALPTRGRPRQRELRDDRALTRRETARGARRHLGPLCGDSAADLLHDLESDPRALDVAIRQVLAVQPGATKATLVVDQLEELYTLCRDDHARERFLDAIVDTTANDDGRTAIVVALRADFFAHAAAHPAFARLLESHTLLVGPMDEAGLREVIEGPAGVAGLALEPGLADIILRDVVGEPGDLPCCLTPSSRSGRGAKGAR